jgi:hypothetical protein
MFRLGWHWNRPNDFKGPDERALKDTFGSLQSSLHWPYIGLRFDGTMTLTGTLAPVPASPKSGAANPFVPGDPYSLWRASTNDIMVPREFDTWMLLGEAAFLTNTLGEPTDVVTFGWRVNGSNDIWFGHWTGSDASRGQSGIMRAVRKGDTIQVVAASSGVAPNEDLTAMEAWAVFLPLG